MIIKLTEVCANTLRGCSSWSARKSGSKTLFGEKQKTQ